jgi:hypothetical protein
VAAEGPAEPEPADHGADPEHREPRADHAQEDHDHPEEHQARPHQRAPTGGVPGEEEARCRSGERAEEGREAGHQPTVEPEVEPQHGRRETEEQRRGHPGCDQDGHAPVELAAVVARDPDAGTERAQGTGAAGGGLRREADEDDAHEHDPAESPEDHGVRVRRELDGSTGHEGADPEPACDGGSSKAAGDLLQVGRCLLDDRRAEGTGRQARRL